VAKPVPVIGVDLDNTIVSYDENMHKIALELGLINKDVPKNKTAIREYIRTNPNGEMNWQRLQAIAYGSRMSEAKLVDGAAEFFILCKKHKIPVYIISHKTEYSNYRVDKHGKTDKSERIDAETKKAVKVNLRKAALGWMRKKGFFSKLGLSLGQVFFFSARKEKIAKIKEVKCTHFIDDLDEVFKEPEFPRSVVKILYMNKTEFNDVLMYDSWCEINNYFFGEEKIRQVFSDLLSEKIVSLEQIGGGRNSKVFKLTTNKKVFLAKQYFKQLNDPRDRLETEFSSLDFLQKHGVRCVPKPIRRDVDNYCAIYEFIEGKKISKPDEKDMQQAIEFVSQLKKLAKPKPDFPAASDACFSFQAIVNIIERRLEKLLPTQHHREKDKLFAELHDFLDKSFKPAYEQILSWAKKKAEEKEIDFTQELEAGLHTLSPSDFGFHNSIKKADGKLVFTDFEYFGYDSPMKLISDFLLHDSMSLSEEQKKEFVATITSIFNEDKFLPSRVEIAYHLFGLVWCLIFLNEFLHEDVQRRVFASRSASSYNSNPTELIKATRVQQLEKARKLLSKIIKTYHDFPFKVG
jgi:thiamine kinase-like enzyme